MSLIGCLVPPAFFVDLCFRGSKKSDKHPASTLLVWDIITIMQRGVEEAKRYNVRNRIRTCVR